MVDLLGKNQLFDLMWDVVRSMKKECMLSIPTFVSIFGSYFNIARFDKAIMSFDVMDRYGIQQDVVAVNFLLSAICNEENQTTRALEFFERIKRWRFVRHFVERVGEGKQCGTGNAYLW